MRQLAEYAPLALFLAVFFLRDIYWATAALMLSYSIGMLYLYSLDGKLSGMHKGGLFFILVLGTMTLIFQNEKFIQWKPTIANWAFAIAFLASHKFSEQPLVKTLFGKAVILAKKDWLNLSLMWVTFFILVGIANLYVAYNYDMAFWVKFKVFGLLGVTIVFSILQGIWLMRKGEMIEDEDATETDSTIIETSKDASNGNGEPLSREDKIKQLLNTEFPDASIDLINESHLHAGHSGAQDGRGHFRLQIISEGFKGLRSIQRHQKIYKTLGALMETDIHALAIDAKTPDEVFA